MRRLLQFVTDPSPCTYLPEERWELEYEIIQEATAEDYFQKMCDGWRRFGHAFFRPVCRDCQACQPLRIVVDQFRPNRSQRRALKTNADVSLEIGEPCLDRARLELYDKYHEYQSWAKGWRVHEPKSPNSYAESFLDNPFPTEEWIYWLDGRMIGVGYVDRLSRGLSAIYFFYDPDERHRSLGTFNVLQLIENAGQSGIPHVYLGYFVEGCQSVEYKANFRLNQVRTPEGEWIDFRLADTGSPPW